MASIFTAPLPHIFPPHKLPSRPTKYRIKVSKFTSKSHKSTHKALPFVHNLGVFSFQEASRCSMHGEKLPLEPFTSSKQRRQSVFSIGYLEKPEESIVQCITRPIAYVLFCIAIGFYPFGAFPARAIAVPVANEVELRKKEKELNHETNLKGHEYSDYTRRLLEEVSRLVNCIEEVRKGNGGLERVGLVMKAVKAKKEELQGEIMEGLYRALRELKKEKESLMKRADEIVDEVANVKREYDKLGKKTEKERMAGLEERMRVMEEEYSGIWERVGEIEDGILRRETMAMSIGVRELCFIERECEELVKGFSQEMRQKSTDRYPYKWKHFGFQCAGILFVL